MSAKTEIHMSERLADEADLCAHEGAEDIAALLMEGAIHIRQIEAERDKLAERVAALEAENDRFVLALAECRNAFPIPGPGGPAKDEWMQAMGCPESVPTFVRAAIAAMNQPKEAT